MTKYTLILMLLVLLLLDNRSIYGRSHSWQSEENKDDTYNVQNPHRPLQHELNVRNLHDLGQQHVQNEVHREALLSAVKRHIERQSSHLQQHRQHYRRPREEINYQPVNNHHKFPAMSHILYHRETHDDNFYGDPLDNAENSLTSAMQSRSAEAIADEGYIDRSGVDENYGRNDDSMIEVLPSHIRCPKCESQGNRVEHVTKEQLTRLRIDFVKDQILEKLRLKERPNVSAIDLPKPIYESTTIQHGDDEMKRKNFDDYYARTSKKFIFLKREVQECKRLGPNPSVCFSFKIDDVDADGFDVNTAILWIFKNKQTETFLSSNKGQKTIVVSEVQQQLDPKYLPKVKPIAIQSVNVQGAWMQIDIVWPIKRWFGNHDLSHLIHISCQSCELSSMDEMISVDRDYRPFIMIDTQNRRRVSRQRRSVNCTDGITECCREKLYISFDDIGWGDWIIQPRGYDAYFCRGKCGSLASVTQITSPHSSFLQKVISSNRFGTKPLELIPCCTAKQYSSLQLVFMDSNNTATLKTFPNMVVESCGCR